MKDRSLLVPVALAALVLLAGCADDPSPRSSETPTSTADTVVSSTATDRPTDVTSTTMTSLTTSVGTPNAKLLSFARFATDCGRDATTLEIDQSSTTYQLTVTVRGRIPVNDTAVTVGRPELVKTGTTTYRLNVETNDEAEDGRSGRTCSAQAAYKATVRLPKLEGVTLVIVHDGEPVGIVEHVTKPGKTPRTVTKTT